MIDLHCHILPDVDDGADSVETACEMAAMAVASGVDTVVATPHCNTRNELKNYRSPALDEHFAMLQDAFDFYKIPLRVLTGSEVLVRGDMDRLLKERRFYTLAGSEYLLTEFYFDEPPEYMSQELARIADAGYIPVVAHPERYFAVADMPELVRDWHDRGYVIQVNKGSILGRFTEDAYEIAGQLLSERIADVLASDAHHYEMRTPDMSDLVLRLEGRVPDGYLRLLLEDNPRHILENQAVQQYLERS